MENLNKGKSRDIWFHAEYFDSTTQESFGTHTIYSNNLYQIFTYVKNKEKELENVSHEVSGLLLYAKTDKEIQPNGNYKMSGNSICVKTLDLDQDFVK